MNEVILPRQAEPRKLLQLVIEEEIPAIMSYLSRGKWHVAKVLLKELGASRLHVLVIPGKKPHPLNIQVEQPVGVSLKYKYGKVVFDSTILDFEPSCDKQEGGQIILAAPDRVEIIQRRSYFRVNVPKSLRVNVTLWHRSYGEPDEVNSPKRYWKGKLVDISAGGLQVIINKVDEPDFKKGQFVSLRFTPMPYEMPLMFNAQIRNTLLTADEDGLCLGMQIVGLEASPEGQQTLQRMCKIVEQYYQINQSSAKQRELQTMD